MTALTDLIDTTSEVGMKIRSGHILKNMTKFGPETMLVMDLSTPNAGTSTLYVVRGYNQGGRVTITAAGTGTTLNSSATQAHDATDKWAVVGLVTSEENLVPASFRGGYTQRFNLIQMIDFATSEGFFEGLFQRKNVPARFANPMQHAFDLHQLQFFEVWNKNALYGVRKADKILGFTFYATAGILSEVKRYCTEKWSGNAGNFGGEADFHTGTWTEYLANGESNYRYGLPTNPDTPMVFGEEMLNTLNAKVIEKLGTGGNNKQFYPTTIYGPAKFRRIFGQIDKSKFTNMKSNFNVTAGYFVDHYIAEIGNTLGYVVEDDLVNTILIGNPANCGQKRSLITMAKYTPVTQDRTKHEWYTSIMGFSWMYPEYAWGVHENVSAN